MVGLLVFGEESGRGARRMTLVNIGPARRPGAFRRRCRLALRRAFAGGRGRRWFCGGGRRRRWTLRRARGGALRRRRRRTLDASLRRVVARRRVRPARLSV